MSRSTSRRRGSSRRERIDLPTHRRILDEAEHLIGLKGVYGFTLRDIAVPLGVQVPAIYKHYRSRDDVLIEVSKRYIALLSRQFAPAPGLGPLEALRAGLDEFVSFMARRPAYVRLALADFATPGGGMEYVKLAAGGSFRDNFVGGPLAAMHTRLRRVLLAGARSGVFRHVRASDAYGLLKAALLIRLVFPDDQMLTRPVRRSQLRALQDWLWQVLVRWLTPAGSAF